MGGSEVTGGTPLNDIETSTHFLRLSEVVPLMLFLIIGPKAAEPTDCGLDPLIL